MYTIGQFSKIGRVSTKMLRHYDKINLLKPSEINVENGYRYYDASQIREIMFICKLKSYRFSLEEIKLIMVNNDNELLYKLMKKKLLELRKEAEKNNLLMSEIDLQINKLKEGEDIMGTKRQFKLETVNIDNTLALTLRDTISMEQISVLIGKVFENVYKNGLKCLDCPFVFYYDEDFDSSCADVEVCVPVDREFKSEQIKTRIVAGGLYVFTTFIGPYSEITEAYSALSDWIKTEKYEIVGAPFEKYITDPASRISPNEYVTEVYFPVKK